MKTLGKVLLFVAGGFVLLVVGYYLLWCLLALTGEKTMEVVVDIPNSNNQLLICEYVDFWDGDIEFYLKRPWHFDKYLGTADFVGRTCPIVSGEYELLWEEDAVIVRYHFSRNYWQEVRLEFPP